MRFLNGIPLMAFPVSLYAIFAFLSQNPLEPDKFVNIINGKAVTIKLASGPWDMSGGTIMIVMGVCILFYELIRETPAFRFSMIRHTARVFIAITSVFLFIFVKSFSTNAFFILTVLCVLNVVGIILLDTEEEKPK